jgi:uncharacterized protein
MATSVLVMADTHVPARARDLPDEVWSAVGAADVVVHAGDWVDVALLDRLESRARRLVGVYGNNDHGVLRTRLPEVARVELGGVRLGVVHETGPARGREARCVQRFPELDVLVFGHSHVLVFGHSHVLVFGHSHIPWDTTAPQGLRLLNPGSPTDRRRQPHRTYMTALADAGELRDVRLHRIGSVARC